MIQMKTMKKLHTCQNFTFPIYEKQLSYFIIQTTWYSILPCRWDRTKNMTSIALTVSMTRYSHQRNKVHIFKCQNGHSLAPWCYNAPYASLNTTIFLLKLAQQGNYVTDIQILVNEWDSKSTGKTEKKDGMQKQEKCEGMVMLKGSFMVTMTNTKFNAPIVYVKTQSMES